MSEASMTAEILATITSSGAAVKSVVEAIKTARGKAKGNAEALAALLDAQELALSLQTSLFEAKEQALALQEENRELRAQIRQYEERTLDRENYERRNVSGTTVIVPKDNQNTFLCPTCFEAGAKVYLTRLSGVFSAIGSHHCSRCDAHFSLRG